MLLAQVSVAQSQPLRLHNQPYEKYAGSVGQVIRDRETMFLVKLNAEMPGSTT
jgi:ribosomal protein L21E